MIQFGAGQLFAVMTQDAQGNALATPTPVQFGVIQNVDLDISFEEKMLYGSRQFPVAVARGKGKIEGKAKLGSFNGRILGDYIFGSGSEAGIRAMVVDFSATAATSITVTPPDSGAFATDLGVRNGTTGLPLTRVASSPSVGEYSVNTGTGAYTLNASQTGTVLISYEYTANSATAKRGDIDNLLMGYTPFFGVRLQREYAGKKLFLSLLQCSSNTFNLPAQNDDFVISDFNFAAFSNAADQVGYWSTSE